MSASLSSLPIHSTWTQNMNMRHVHVLCRLEEDEILKDLVGGNNGTEIVETSMEAIQYWVLTTEYGQDLENASTPVCTALSVIAKIGNNQNV